jgi:O-antigen/teichoic acid export membrane protein
MLGTAPVAIYVLCVQAAQPIHGLSAAAFNFVFPHISSRYEAGELHGPQRVFRLTVLSSLSLSLALGVPLVLFGKPLLTLWMGPEFAKQAYGVLAVLAVAHIVLAINIVPHYTLLAFGHVRFVSTMNIAAGILSLGAAALFIQPFGLLGAALGRLLYGPVLAFNYLKVRAAFEETELMRGEALIEST